MWIRSQDKLDLINVNRIGVEKEKIYAYTDTSFEGCNWICVGKYNTNERALEILDDMQNNLRSLMQSQNGQTFGVRPYSYIYEMPQV